MDQATTHSERDSSTVTETSLLRSPQRPPRGYVPTLALSQFGMYLALIAPTIGGLSVKIQGLVGLEAAPGQLGFVTGIGALFALVVQPLAGRLSDRTTSRFGMRRPWIAVGVIGMALALVGCALASSIPLLLVAWCAAQLFANFAFAAQSASIADQVPEPKRGGVSGIIGAATPLGVLVGAVLLALLPNDVLRFTVPAVIALIVGLLFALALKDRVRATKPAEPLSVRQLLSSFVFDPRKNPDFGWAWLSKLLILLGYMSISTYLTLYLASAYGMEIDEQLAFNSLANVVGVSALIVFSVLGGFLSDRVGRRKPFVVASGLVIAVGVALIAGSPAFGAAGLGTILIGEAILGAGAGCFFAVDQALCIALLPDPEHTAKDLGVLNIANTLPSSIAPLLGGVLVIPLGNALFAGGGYTLWFAVATIIAIVGAFLVLRIRGVR
ncbi:MFS transporter [Herbiconiux sp. CPCC 205763]|uniref:MFS transporter n=1 Tax=Herbiconiux aconitum TaxID=2970913 RepID=A0ABT2GM56_9MICO|nr:MFS transporter [Herbiconiux aconitum]MCS5717312.1 MFS transporter [Herbiconiux aconitum]